MAKRSAAGRNALNEPKIDEGTDVRPAVRKMKARLNSNLVKPPFFLRLCEQLFPDSCAAAAVRVLLGNTDRHHRRSRVAAIRVKLSPKRSRASHTHGPSVPCLKLRAIHLSNSSVSSQSLPWPAVSPVSHFPGRQCNVPDQAFSNVRNGNALRYRDSCR